MFRKKPQSKIHELSDNDETTITHEERVRLAQVEARAKFERDYIRRSEALYDVRKAISRTRLETSFYILFFIVGPLCALTVAYHQQKSDRIDCRRLAQNSIRYLEQAGESLPASCN